jgi:hypothetical protein
MLSRLLKQKPPPSGDTSVARAKLRAAHAERNRAKDQLVKAQERAESLRGVIASVRDAEAEVERLDAAIKQAGVDWAQSGADPAKEPPSERKLLAELREARNLVEERRRRAESASAVFGVDTWDRGLGRSTRQDTTPDEVAAQDSLSDAESAIKSAIRDVMVATVESHLKRLQVLHDEYVLLFPAVRGLDTALSGAGNYSSFAGDRGALAERLRAVSVSCDLASDADSRTQRSREIYAESGPWVAFGEALVKDPDAPPPSP